MTMEPQEIVLGSSNNNAIKGKRTKRPRPLSPLRLGMMTTSSSSCGGIDNNNSSSCCSINEFSAASTVGGEEEDMANCLILLAQGRKLSEPTEATATTATTKGLSSGGGGSSSYVYQCKTCNRCFPSFQALGGHRASHKKPNNNHNNKVGNDQVTKKGILIEEADQEDHRRRQLLNDMNTTLSLQLANRGSSSYGSNSMIKSNKVHECSICGAEFSSGQALGGHMRRHRAAFTNNSIAPPTPTAVRLVTSNNPEFQEAKKSRRNSLELDLNLPAPEDDHRESKFHFVSKEQVLVFSASPLVDCHF